uniref:Uncharacterized protein n=1 Tax=uncultured Planctomycetota bacterium TaxID=120965 RepID=H5SCA8_9BACT|nr:hypothetical protein HGMM_F08F10C13 [uncultured Planctomycetota bacterium]
MLSVITLLLGVGLQEMAQFAVLADDRPDFRRRETRHIVVGIGQPIRASSGIPWTLEDEDKKGNRFYSYYYQYNEWDEEWPKPPRPQFVMRVTAPTQKEWTWRFEPEGIVTIRAGGPKNAEKVFGLFITRLYPANDLRELDLYLRAEFRRLGIINQKDPQRLLKRLREEWKRVGARPQEPRYEFRDHAQGILDYKIIVIYTINMTRNQDGRFRADGNLLVSWLDSDRWELRKKMEPELWEKLTREAQR